MRSPQRTVVVCADPEALARRAADAFEAACATAARSTGRFSAALSGGRTPRAMLASLASRAIDWTRAHLFWSDERCVPPDDPESNYKMAADALLSHTSIPASNVHRIKGELPAADAARLYRNDLQAFFGGRSTPFDLLFLGLGADGHTASLFPGSAALTDATGEPAVAASAPPGVPSPWRVTLTYAGIATGKHIVFLVEGLEKADIVARVLEGPLDPATLPAQGVAPVGGDVLWMLDRAAASKLCATPITK
jgi:6-phosphogluconolactonase